MTTPAPGLGPNAVKIEDDLFFPVYIVAGDIVWIEQINGNGERALICVSAGTASALASIITKGRSDGE